METEDTERRLGRLDARYGPNWAWCPPHVIKKVGPSRWVSPVGFFDLLD